MSVGHKPTDISQVQNRLHFIGCYMVKSFVIGSQVIKILLVVKGSCKQLKIHRNINTSKKANNKLCSCLFPFNTFLFLSFSFLCSLLFLLLCFLLCSLFRLQLLKQDNHTSHHYNMRKNLTNK